MRDASERDLGAHLETALRGVVIGERWPKSAAEIVVTVLEGEEDGWWGDSGLRNSFIKGSQEGAAGNALEGRNGRTKGVSGLGMMNVLAGCITAASAAIVDAGIDCVDLVSGGVAAVESNNKTSGHDTVLLDPCPSEHAGLSAACVVGYLHSRDEVTELWMKGDAGPQPETLIDQAVEAAVMTRSVLAEAVREGAEQKYAVQTRGTNGTATKGTDKAIDVEMKG